MSGGRLLVSGPHRYPYHPDPIDTTFRPSVEQMAKLFPDTRIITSEIVPCGTYLQYITRTPKKFATSMLRLGLPVYHPRDWLSAVLRLGWLHRTFEVVCVALEKL
ncbi:MAG TPA: hypothetical protein VHU80_11590 [Polyangiaceae bacterium]|nr:hypothetical protein [Polyangiaceae bacterium]